VFPKETTEVCQVSSDTGGVIDVMPHGNSRSRERAAQSGTSAGHLHYWQLFENCAPILESPHVIEIDQQQQQQQQRRQPAAAIHYQHYATNYPLIMISLCN
jgi:hypothetical protein